MSQQSNDHPYEVAHVVARLAGEDPEHPRQRAVRWLESHACQPKTIAAFNRKYEETHRSQPHRVAARIRYAIKAAIGTLCPRVDRAEVSRDIEQYAYARQRIGAGLDAPDPT